jgi:hypothetical protein
MTEFYDQHIAMIIMVDATVQVSKCHVLLPQPIQPQASGPNILLDILK